MHSIKQPAVRQTISLRVWMNNSTAKWLCFAVNNHPASQMRHEGQQRLFNRKVCPGLEANSGMQFPIGTCLGNCGTEFCFIVGRTFRDMPQLESGSRNSGSEWDGVSAC